MLNRKLNENTKQNCEHMGMRKVRECARKEQKLLLYPWTESARGVNRNECCDDKVRCVILVFFSVCMNWTRNNNLLWLKCKMVCLDSKLALTVSWLCFVSVGFLSLSFSLLRFVVGDCSVVVVSFVSSSFMWHSLLLYSGVCVVYPWMALSFCSFE